MPVPATGYPHTFSCVRFTFCVGSRQELPTRLSNITCMNNFLLPAIVLLLSVSGCSARNTTEPSPGPSNVLVVVNRSSPDSIEVGRYYARKRAIDSRFICNVDCPIDEIIKDEIYEEKLRKPIREFLQTANLEAEIDYIVLTRGIPIKTASNWGIDSALTVLRRDVSKQIANPYFSADEPFSSRKYGIYLVTRLDGLSLADARALVDRSLAAKPNKGPFLIDVDPAWDFTQGYKIVNDGMREAAKILKERGFDVTLDSGAEFAVGQNLAGYYSWGSNAKKHTHEDYAKISFVPGAIAETAVSTSAFTLTANHTLEGKRSYVTDLIAQGATGVKGYVYEPYTLAMAVADILFDRYTRGYNLAESYYAASRALHWRDIVFGDPLCAPYATGPRPEPAR